MRARAALVGLLVATALVVACGGHVALEGRSCPCLDGWVCCAASNVCALPSDAGKTCSSGIAPTAKNIQTLCAASGATLGPPSTAAALTALLARPWYACTPDPTSVSGLVAHDGLQFTDDGHWFFLKRTGDAFACETEPDATGTFEMANSHFSGDAHFVPPTDTTFDRQILLEWLYKGRLELATDFQEAPLRFHTWNGIHLWFVALDGDGRSLEGAEGMACDGTNAVCQRPGTCVSENNSGICSAPAVVGRGEGCDHKPVRACAQGLTCLDTRRCGVVHAVGERCDGVLDVCTAPAVCNDGTGLCSAPTP
jgi:hypothetical protein